MATAFTHALFGSLLAPLAPAGVPRGRLVVALAALAVAPDLDVIAFPLGIPYAHPLGHRGITHSLLFGVVAGVSVTRLVFPTLSLGSREGRRVALLLALACASHGVLDAFTDAGLGVGFFIPFSDARFFFPWRPLAASPIGIDAFFGGPALRILANEMLWVGLPCALVAAALALLRRR